MWIETSASTVESEHAAPFVQGELARVGEAGWFATAVNLGNFHEINYRDKVVLATMIERLRRRGGITHAHFGDIPFDVLDDFAADSER